MNKRRMVIIDNGHGSNTAGKCSPDGRYYEWKWTRKMARLLRDELKRRGIAAHLLVEEDTDVSLGERCRRAAKICREYSDAVLVSVHSNASGGKGEWGRASGWSAWVAVNASQRSQRLAQLLTAEARRTGLEGNRATPPCGFWVADYAICRDTRCPAVLTENLFHDNRADLAYLMSEEGTARLAGLHADAIYRYYEGD